MQPSNSLFFCDEFVISCGTVTLDLRLSKVLLIRWRKTGQLMLPKGRKNVGETLEDAALRETFEETGYMPTLLPLPIPTLSVIENELMESPIDTTPRLVTEAVAVTQRNSVDGIRKIIFWYAAQADSTLEQVVGTQKENEDFETLWTRVDQIDKIMAFEADRKVANKVVEAAKDVLHR